jgi:saccharopine dehydrogenase (NAD+, L-lysine forming)
MAHLIGIRREDKNEFERRTPLVPLHLGTLARDHGLTARVQPSPRRIHDDESYRLSGATVDEDLSECPLIMGIKEVPPDALLPGKAYLYFSHTIKGQPYNLPMLRKLLELGCTLMDYERVVDEKNRRLIFFGRHAGLAGMIDSLCALGRRLEAEGVESPLAMIRPAHNYPGLAAAVEDVKRVGELLRRAPLPEHLRPLTFGVTGYGNVSMGAQEILDHLGVDEVSVDELAEAAASSEATAIKTVFREEHLVQPIPGSGSFHLEHYYKHPEGYTADFTRHLPHLHVLINCIYWEPRYPRLVSNDDLAELYGGAEAPRLRVIGDISCDVEGSVQATVKATEPDNPVFVYDLDRGEAVDGVEGRGPVIMSVDNLPAELPREASEHFSNTLQPFAPALATANYTAPFEALTLPPPLLRSVITHAGQLTPDYKYLEEHL